MHTEHASLSFFIPNITANETIQTYLILPIASERYSFVFKFDATSKRLEIFA